MKKFYIFLMSAFLLKTSLIVYADECATLPSGESSHNVAIMTYCAAMYFDVARATHEQELQLAVELEKYPKNKLLKRLMNRAKSDTYRYLDLARKFLDESKKCLK